MAMVAMVISITVTRVLADTMVLVETKAQTGKIMVDSRMVQTLLQRALPISTLRSSRVTNSLYEDQRRAKKLV